MNLVLQIATQYRYKHHTQGVFWLSGYYESIVLETALPTAPPK